MPALFTVTVTRPGNNAVQHALKTGLARICTYLWSGRILGTMRLQISGSSIIAGQAQSVLHVSISSSSCRIGRSAAATTLARVCLRGSHSEATMEHRMRNQLITEHVLVNDHRIAAGSYGADSFNATTSRSSMTFT